MSRDVCLIRERPISSPTSSRTTCESIVDLLRNTLSRDRGRLLRLHAASRKTPKDDASARAAFEGALAASRAAVEARAASAPVPTFDDSLPIAREAQTIVELIRKHQVVVIAGETGSGKTRSCRSCALRPDVAPRA